MKAVKIPFVTLLYMAFEILSARLKEVPTASPTDNVLLTCERARLLPFHVWCLFLPVPLAR